MEKQIDYAEQLLEAMKVVSQAEVQGVSFDKTIQCTIVDVKDAEIGTYMVNNGSANFIAYSKDTDYKVNDVVLVTIPQGDYNQQKIIIGKYIAKNSTPFVYKNPFDYFVDITGNLVSSSRGEYSILANYVPQNVICPEGPVGLWTCLGTKNQVPLTGYDTMGLRAEFMTLLKGFKVVTGNYGLRVLITYLNSATNVDDNASFLNDYNQHLNSGNSSLLIRKINTVLGNLGGAQQASVSNSERKTINKLYSQKNYYFDVDDMYGDPYDFDTYYQQQILFDISDIDKIVAIQVDLYQSWDEENGQVVGSFKDSTGRRILPYDEVFTDELYMDNIFTKGIYLALGYDESQFSGDKLILFTQDNETYSVDNNDEINKKTIHARWIHQDDTGEVLLINSLENFPGSQLNWYRYRQAEEAPDSYSGVSWVKLTPTDTQEFYAKTINDGWSCEMVPSTELEEETIKAILIYGENKIVRSNPMTFSNEDDVPSGITVRQLSDFYLVATDGLNGVYNLYDNEDKIVSQSLSNDTTTDDKQVDPSVVIRSLTTVLKDSELHDIEYIKWCIPWEYTMLIPCGKNGNPIFSVQYNDVEEKNEAIVYPENLPNYNTTVQWQYSTDENYVYLVRQANPPISGVNLDPSAVTNVNKIQEIEGFDWDFYYKINDSYIQSYTNNGVTCQIVKDRITYSYTYTFRFGRNGTNGSDYTLDLSFVQVDPKKMPDKALEVGNYAAKLKVHLDLWKKNKTEPEDWNNNTLYGNVDIKWDWFTCIGTNSYYFDYVEVHPDNIPQYRKDYDDLNDGTMVNNEYVPRAKPIYYENTAELNEDPSYDVYEGKYSDEKDDIGGYVKHYYVKILKPKEVNMDPHIKIYHSDLSNYQGNYENRLTEVMLVPLSGLTINELYVLRVTVRGVMPYPLVGYLPVPLYRSYKGMKPNYIGVEKVGYTSYGTINYNGNPCRITWIGSDNRIINLPNDGLEFINDTPDFKLFIPARGTRDFREGEDTLDYPILNDREILEPLQVYLTTNPPFGIQYWINNVVYYTQPVFCYQNQWGNGTINGWDGTGLIINEEDGYIIGHSITAGKKENDNTFTGVMLGDLGVYENTETYLKQNTGVYGFHHGSIAYAFKDDGTAVIGKPGHGRIEFNGNNGTIQSSSWRSTVSTPHGMSIDLDDGIIEMAKPGFYEVIDQEEDYEDFVDDFNDLKSSIYRYVGYKLYRGTLYQDNQDKLNYDIDHLEFYLPRSFYRPELTIDGDNYESHKFYQKTVNNVYDNEPSFPSPTPIDSSNIVTYDYRSYLENTTYITSSITRLDMTHNYPCFIIAEYEWKYIRSGENLVPTLQKITYNNYSLVTNSEFDNTLDYYLPDETNFEIATEGELALFKSGTENYNYWLQYDWFYTSINEYISCKNDEGYNNLETYYKMGSSDHFINVSVAHQVYPLAIGTARTEGLRKFRVTWDGYVYAEHGKFTGTIQADTGYLRNLEIRGQLYTRDYKDQITTNKPGIFGAYIQGSRIVGANITADKLECDYGELGGWYVDSNGLYNQAYKTGKRSSASGTLGQIYLNSKADGINLWNAAIKVRGDRNSSSTGYMGWLKQYGSYEGLGIAYVDGSSNSENYTVIPATDTSYVMLGNWGAQLAYANSSEGGCIEFRPISIPIGNDEWGFVGCQCFIDATEGIYITAGIDYGDPSSASISDLSSLQLTGNTVTAKMFDAFKIDTLQYFEAYAQHGIFSIEKDPEHFYWHLYCSIPPDKQHGIYARFA